MIDSESSYVSVYVLRDSGDERNSVDSSLIPSLAGAVLKNIVIQRVNSGFSGSTEAPPIPARLIDLLGDW